MSLVSKELYHRGLSFRNERSWIYDGDWGRWRGIRTRNQWLFLIASLAQELTYLAEEHRMEIQALMSAPRLSTQIQVTATMSHTSMHHLSSSWVSSLISDCWELSHPKPTLLLGKSIQDSNICIHSTVSFLAGWHLDLFTNTSLASAMHTQGCYVLPLKLSFAAMRTSFIRTSA